MALLARSKCVESASSGQTNTRHRRRRSLLVSIFAATLFIASGIEASTGAWINTQLTGVGVSSGAASFVAASFWAALTAGRVAMVPLTLRWGEKRLVAVSVMLVLPAFAVVSIGRAGVVVYALVGLLIAPIFPCLMTWASRAIGHPEQVGTLLFGAALLGSGVMPPVVGRAIDNGGLRAFPLTLVGLALLFMVLLTVLHRKELFGSAQTHHRKARFYA